MWVGSLLEKACSSGCVGFASTQLHDVVSIAKNQSAKMRASDDITTRLDEPAGNYIPLARYHARLVDTLLPELLAVLHMLVAKPPVGDRSAVAMMYMSVSYFSKSYD